MPFFIRLSLAALLVILMMVPAQAQSKKELAAQNFELSQRLERLERRMLTGDPAAERLMQRMDSLEENMRTLTGEVERLRFERDQLRAEVSAATAKIQNLEGLAVLAGRMQTHLDAVDLVEQQRASAPAPSYRSPYSTTITGEPNFPSAGVIDPNQPSSVPSAPSFGEKIIEVQQYSLEDLPQTGRTKLAEGDFLGAQTAFKQYLQINPDAADAGEVNYWLGEAYVVRGGYADAADAYIASMRKDPQGELAPNAMVGLAVTMRELGNKAQACNALGSLTAQYPNAGADVQEKARVETARTGC
jgi:tol-pal system protein YbgF